MGSSGRVMLRNSNARVFEAGQTDEFTVTCKSVGNLAQMLLGHDNSGMKAAWHPEVRYLRGGPRASSLESPSTLLHPEPSHICLNFPHTCTHTHSLPPSLHLLPSQVVSVTDLTTHSTWWFDANMWFSTRHGDGATERVLPALGAQPIIKQICTYQVVVVTTDIAASGTDAKVHLIMYSQVRDALSHIYI